MDRFEIGAYTGYESLVFSDKLNIRLLMDKT